jgi:uncharacterized protein (TIGR03067 family)
MTNAGTRRVAVAFVAAFSITVAALAQEPSPLEGVWVPADASFAGKSMPEQFLKTIKLEVRGDAYTVTGGKTVDRGTLKRNETAKPKELDIVGTEGPNKGKTILAIYERNGDTLRICYDLAGKARPTDFEARPGTQLLFITYKKAQP